MQLFYLFCITVWWWRASYWINQSSHLPFELCSFPHPSPCALGSEKKRMKPWILAAEIMFRSTGWAYWLGEVSATSCCSFALRQSDTWWGHCLLEVFWATLTRRRPQGFSATCWINYISQLDWESPTWAEGSFWGSEHLSFFLLFF